MRTRMIATLVTAGLVAGCAVGPNYARPVVPTPAAFRADTAHAELASLADVKWFELFKDERLQQMIRSALAQNFDLRDAVVRVELARANLGITRADQFPTIEASARITAQRSAGGGQARAVGTLAGDLLSFEVDVWGRLRRATEAARADLLASDNFRKAVITTLVSDVASTYFNLLELDMELAIAKRTLQLREDSLTIIRNRDRGGLGTLLEVRQGEQLVYAAAQVIPDVEQRIEQTENQISLLLGGSPTTIARGRSLIDQEQPPSVPAGLPSALLDRRPDILVAEQNLVAANAIIGVAKAAYFPRISLTGFLGVQSDALSNLFSGPARIWQFAPQVTQPIFNAGRLRSNVRLATAQRELDLIEYQRVIQTAFREVSDSLIQYQKVHEIRAQQQRLVTTLQERSRLSYVRYHGGIDTLLSALDADRDLFDAELRLAQTRRNELLALVQLYRALGGGWQ
jgi:multidrug efflux system outer membrane protein